MDCLHEATTKMTCQSVQSCHRAMLALNACVMQFSELYDPLVENCAVLTMLVPAGATGGERSSTRRAAVHVVTAEEACSGAYSIQDVVLPLPGGQIQYPEYKEAQDHDTSHQVLHFLCYEE